MKRLIFMRHGYLEGKYKDYSQLSFEDFEKLLTKEVTPKIDREKTIIILNDKEFLSKIDLILCSEESRAIETALLVKMINSVDVRTTPLLNEVSFTRGIIEKGDTLDFNLLRKKILTRLFYSECSESFEQVKDRLILFLNQAKALKAENILCITHGWFMRLIYIYAGKESLNGISLTDLLEARVPNFLERIEVNL